MGELSEQEKREQAYFEHVEALAGKANELAAVLQLIASPPRNDGTYNRDRKACQILAENALKDFNK
jgi:hypothetical protein